tara:strand:+ start:517 stop:762 length:246 start_codon:yes stop_codon:yes gene_type:complete
VIIAKGLYPIPFELGSQILQRRWYFVLRYGRVGHCQAIEIMKIKSSLKSLKKRDLNSKLVRRRGRVYIINKTNPKFKARQK